MKIQKIAAIYFVFLGFSAFLNAKFPTQMALCIQFFIPIEIDVASQAFISYRMTLFLAATIVLLILFPIIWRTGFYGTSPEKIRKIHFGNFIVAILILPIGWIGYPILSLCTTCLTANDFFYFFLTVIFFIALQIFSQAIVCKITQIIGK